MIPSKTHLVLIPAYNPGGQVVRVVEEVLQYWQPIWVVIDGSDDGSERLLDELAGKQAALTLLRHPYNQGKGSAVYTGVQQALAQGFSHVLTLDADGQHPASFIAEFMQCSQANPQAMILGVPVFAQDAPTVRVKGRKISNFWANLETLWAGIGDSLFGFRVYPLPDLQRVMQQTHFARRFDFDPEVVVRMVWNNVPVINRPAPVRYIAEEEGGISHFNYLRDNLLLIWMHTRLFLEFMMRLPVLLKRRCKP